MAKKEFITESQTLLQAKHHFPRLDFSESWERKGDGVKKTEIFFPFEPVSKGRPRFFRGHAYTPQKTQDYEKKIAEYYKSQTDDFYDGAIKIKLVFNMPIPKTTTKKNRQLIASGMIKCTVHKDVDNMGKALLDSLNGLAYDDDRLITKLTIIKQYAIDENVGTLMEICEDVE